MASAQNSINNAAQNPLCGRLQQKFSGRGVAAVSTAETRTFPRVRAGVAAAGNTKYAKTVNPFEETAQFVPADVRTRAKVGATAGARPRSYAEDTAWKYPNRAAAGAFFATGAYAAAYARGAEVRKSVAACHRKHVETVQENAKKRRGILGWMLYQMQRAANWVRVGGRKDEVRVKSKPFPKGVLLAAVVFTAMILMIVFSLAQIHEFKKEISGLEADRADLHMQISQMSVELDLKNDIRVIEQTAREDYGMVRSSQVETRYINIAGGDRGEVVETGEDTDAEWGILDAVLAVFDRTWDNILDHIH